MAKFSLKCPHCRGKFPWDPTAGMPDNCALCGEFVGTTRADDDIVMPFIRSASSKATDKVYRDMEAGSEVRAEAAAMAAGVPVSDMADLKITNLNSTRHAGDIAAPEVRNSVSDFMQTTGIGGFKGVDGAGYSGAVQSGPAPNAGARMRTALHGAHGALAGGGAVSDRPALETTQVGYRRRG